MGLFVAILVILIGPIVAIGRRSMQQRQELVLARLTKLTKSRMQPEISEAWNERRIIRIRLQAYASK